MQRLSGKVAMVTGATGGIGAATVDRFIQEGANVALAVRSVERGHELARQYGDRACVVHFELDSDDSIEAAVEKAAAHFGSLDILVNNAAAVDRSMQEGDTSVAEMRSDLWDEIMIANVRSIMVACRSAIPHMLKAGGGSIVNLSSGSGLAGDNVRAAYGTSKAAVISLSRYVAVQYGQNGIRCNAIAPGLVLVEKVADNTALQDMLSRHVLTPRLGIPEDIAALAAFLAAEESGYITGQVICCDGGMLAHQPQYADMIEMMGKR